MLTSWSKKAKRFATCEKRAEKGMVGIRVMFPFEIRPILRASWLVSGSVPGRFLRMIRPNMFTNKKVWVSGNLQAEVTSWEFSPCSNGDQKYHQNYDHFLFSSFLLKFFSGFNWIIPSIFTWKMLGNHHFHPFKRVGGTLPESWLTEKWIPPIIATFKIVVFSNEP